VPKPRHRLNHSTTSLSTLTVVMSRSLQNQDPAIRILKERPGSIRAKRNRSAKRTNPWNRIRDESAESSS
ncbi:hypothetical protein AVEN_211863-1, partial [Araneus ventricosus]